MISDEISGAPSRLGSLILVVEARGDRVMRLVRLVYYVGDRQLRLMRPQSTGFVARRQGESR